MKGEQFTDAQLLAIVLELHKQDRWPNATVAIGDGPKRRALVKAGYLESFRQRPYGSRGGAWRWRLTAAARAALIDMPGSGTRRGTPL